MEELVCGHNARRPYMSVVVKSLIMVNLLTSWY